MDPKYDQVTLHRQVCLQAPGEHGSLRQPEYRNLEFRENNHFNSGTSNVLIVNCYLGASMFKILSDYPLTMRNKRLSVHSYAKIKPNNARPGTNGIEGNQISRHCLRSPTSRLLLKAEVC